eukprot:scaffold201933_cov15-Prasinocladus_malaysianus.AAC.1
MQDGVKYPCFRPALHMKAIHCKLTSIPSRRLVLNPSNASLAQSSSDLMGDITGSVIANQKITVLRYL